MPSSDEEEATTVSFDVGGKIFKVRRSLLEDFPSTMLARSASEEWTGGDSGDKPFLDCNPERFSFCLDYMRFGKVHLPWTQSKAALLSDMDYYGFEDVNPSSIQVDLPVAEAANGMKAIENEFENEVSQAEAAIRQAERKFNAFVKETKRKIQYLKLAHACFREYTGTGKKTLEVSKKQWGRMCREEAALDEDEVDWFYLDDCLEKYKLQAREQYAVFMVLEPLVD